MFIQKGMKIFTKRVSDYQDLGLLAKIKYTLKKIDNDISAPYASASATKT